MKMLIKKISNIFMYLILFIWCVIQNFAGFVLYLLTYRKERTVCKSSLVFNKKLKDMILSNVIIVQAPWGNMGSISLGKFVFIQKSQINNQRIISHEVGHCYQSCLLGVFYLLIVGLPSLIWCSLIYHNSKKPYDWLYCEGWATKLGKKYYG